MRGDLDELQLIAIQLTQYLVGLLQFCDHPLVIGADPVQCNADEIDCHAWTSAQNGLKIPLLHLQHGTFGGGAHSCRTRRALDQRHLTYHIPSASQA